MRKSETKVIEYNWEEFYEQSLRFAKGLHALGIEEGSCISFLGYNSPEHFIALMGSILSNCIVTEIYLTNTPSACLQQIQHSNSKVIVCDTYKTLREKFLINKD